MMNDLRELLGLCLFVAAVCAMLWGVTIDGKHHSVSCSCDHGVVVE